MRSVSIIVLSLSAGICGAKAQEWKQVPSSFINTQGYKVTGYTVRATATGCQGSQNYVKIENPSDRGTSPMRWASVSKQDGGTLCSNGTWYYGGGSKAGRAGGGTSDVLIKNGKFYRRS